MSFREILSFIGSLLVAGQFDNHLWRILCCFALFFLSSDVSIFVLLPFCALILIIPRWANNPWWCRQKSREAAVLITGCDSGMGQATVVYLAQSNAEKVKTSNNQYSKIYAGCLNVKAANEYFAKSLNPEALKYVCVVPLDVTSDESVAAVVKTILNNDHQLSGLIMYHGIAYNGPAAYMPIEMYEKTLQVNFLGYVRMVQHILGAGKSKNNQKPLLTADARIILTGTGGGPCTPCPPLLTAYMSSKFATEAYCQSLRQELYMMGSNIQACMINPGFVKPTLLMEEGMKLTASMWRECESRMGNTKAKDDYGGMLDHFIRYSSLQPGTHVSQVCLATEHALLSRYPKSSYKIGIDSKLAPIVGMLPTGVREWIARHGIYGKLSPAGTISGYHV